MSRLSCIAAGANSMSKVVRDESGSGSLLHYLTHLSQLCSLSLLLSQHTRACSQVKHSINWSKTGYSCMLLPETKPVLKLHEASHGIRFCFLQHMFCIPEKCPPKAVSTAFTVLVFLPLVIMLSVVSNQYWTLSLVSRLS